MATRQNNESRPGTPGNNVSPPARQPTGEGNQGELPSDQMSETQSLVDPQDVIMNNRLENDDVVSTRKRAEELPNSATNLTTVILRDALDLVNDVKSGLKARNNFTGHDALLLPMPTVPDFTVFDRYRDAIYGSLLASNLNIVATDSRFAYVRLPVEALITDGDGMLYDDSARAVMDDSLSLPALVNVGPLEKHIVEVRGRPSLKFYPSNINPNLLNKINLTYDPATARGWQNAFQLRNEGDAMWIIKNRAKNAVVGDNHLLVLFRAYCYYFDSLYAQLPECVPARTGQRLVAHHYNILRDINWVASVSEGSKEIINCIGMPSDYVSFWTYCCTSQPEVYTGFSGRESGQFRSHYSLFNVKVKTRMCTISDISFEINRSVPTWYGKPHTILGFIDMYTSKFGLSLQANAVFALVQNLPLIYSFKAPISLPEPLHSTDWFEGQVDSPDHDTPTHFLTNSNQAMLVAAPLVSLASVRVQLDDLQTLSVAERSGLGLIASDDRFNVNMWREIGNHVGGIAHYVFCILAGNKSYLLELIGWAKTFLNIYHLLPPLTNDLFPSPIHLSTLSRRSAVSSIKSRFIGHSPQLNIDFTLMGDTISISQTDFMLVRRLGVLLPDLQGQDQVSLSKDLPPLLSPGRKVNIRIHPSYVDRLRKFKKGLVIQFRELWGSDEPAIFDIDPMDARPQFESWNAGGLETPALAGQRGGRVLYHDARVVSQPVTTVQPTSVDLASKRLKKTLEKVVAIADGLSLAREKHILAVLENTRCVAWSADYIESGGIVPYATVFSQGDGNCGWLVLQYITGCNHTISHLQRTVCASTVKLATDTLSAVEMVWSCTVLGMNVIICDIEGGVVYNLFKDDQCLSTDDLLWLVLDHNHWVAKSAKPAADDSPSLYEEPDLVGEPRDHSDAPLAVRVYRLNDAISNYESGSLSYETLVQAHKNSFPGAELPRFITCLSRDKYSEVAEDSVNPAEKVTHMLRVYTIGKTRRPATLKARLVGKDESWPHRSPETAVKNNLTVTDIVKLLDVPKDMAKATILQCQDTLTLLWIIDHRNQASEFVASVALWLYSLTLTKNGWLDLLSTDFMLWNEDNWLVNSKAKHDAWRKSGLPTGTDNDWSQLLYMNSLYGRGGVKVDWVKEFSNKATPPTAVTAFDGSSYSESYANEIIKQSLSEVIETAMPHSLPSTFDKFMDDAYEWLVSGSSAGIPSALKMSEMREYLVKTLGLTPRPTKRSVMEAIPREKVLSILSTEPKVVSKAHMKLNETGGKARAIYGVTIWHYIFSNWLMAPIEKGIRHNYVDINLPNKDFITQLSRRASAASSAKVFSSYDYPDFNAMHSHDNMASIYRAALNAYTRHKASLYDSSDDEIITKTFLWLESSTYKQVVLHPETNEIIQTVGGLYSGNRDTTLINTLLNIAYSKVVDMSMANAGIKTGLESRLCHGDDIISIHSTYPQALAWNEMAGKCNLGGQEGKLLTELSYHEYLRVLGCRDGKLRGCLARACATFVNGNWETDRLVGFENKVGELYSSIAVLERRGLSTQRAQKVWKIAFGVAAKRFNWAPGKVEATWEAIAGTPETGKPVIGKEKQNDLNEPPAKLLPGDKINYSRLKSHVTEPYLTKMINKLPEWMPINGNERARLKNKLQQGTYGTELPIAYQSTDNEEMAFRKRLVFEVVSSKTTPARTLAGIVEATKADWRLRQQIKAYHTLLSVVKIPRGYSEVDILVHITGRQASEVRQVLEADGLKANDPAKSTSIGADEEMASMRLASELESYVQQSKWAYSAHKYTTSVPYNDVLFTLENYAQVRGSDIMKY